MFYAAIILGIAGSLHCAGMCSPLMFAVTAQRPLMGMKVVYNTGRVVTYGLLGMAAASLGTLFSFATYQQTLSFALGATLMVFGLVGITGANIPLITPALYRLTSWVKLKFGWALHRPGHTSRFLLGMLNGLLPCGLTYMALTACFILPGPLDGLLYMLAFGLGTWPMMMGLTWLFQHTTIKNWIRGARVTQFALLVAGALLIARVWWGHDSHGMTLHSTMGEETETVCP